MLYRLYFSPGMFGFGRLASYDYFVHLERALTERLRQGGDDVKTHVADVAPTASIRRRAAYFSDLVTSTSGEGPTDSTIHLIGHSTGGLDARLVATPDAALPSTSSAQSWLPRLASVTTINTPHFGTPLASFFATVSGQRMLEALSALTFIGLSLGSPPLAAASAVVLAFGRIDQALGFELAVLDRSINALLRVLDDARSREVRAYLDALKKDQGAIIQLSPEAMDLFQAGVGDRPGVLYQSTASMAPPPSPRTFAGVLQRPWTVLSSAIFTMLYGITGRLDERYPCAAPSAGEQAEALLERAFMRVPGARANDGVVPLRSQIWGKLIWAGYADHLDVLGHFRDDRPRQKRGSLPAVTPVAARAAETHVDWLASGSTFNRAQFGGLADAIAQGLKESAERYRARVTAPPA
jgi:triacylglycerol lipase